MAFNGLRRSCETRESTWSRMKSAASAHRRAVRSVGVGDVDTIGFLFLGPPRAGRPHYRQRRELQRWLYAPRAPVQVCAGLRRYAPLDAEARMRRARAARGSSAAARASRGMQSAYNSAFPL